MYNLFRSLSSYFSICIFSTGHTLWRCRMSRYGGYNLYLSMSMRCSVVPLRDILHGYIFPPSFVLRAHWRFVCVRSFRVKCYCFLCNECTKKWNKNVLVDGIFASFVVSHASRLPTIEIRTKHRSINGSKTFIYLILV